MTIDNRTARPLLGWTAEEYHNPPVDAMTGKIVDGNLVVTIPTAEAVRIIDAVNLAVPRLLAPFPIALIRLRELAEESGLPGTDERPVHWVEQNAELVAARAARHAATAGEQRDLDDLTPEEHALGDFIGQYLAEHEDEMHAEYAAHLEERAGLAQLEQGEWVRAWRERAVAEATRRFQTLRADVTRAEYIGRERGTHSDH